MIINLIPMAGEGKRFVDAGYRIAKPLIPVAGVPMILRAARCLPTPDRWVFVCRREHLDSHHIDQVLHNSFRPLDIVPVDHSTQGQACTCLIARPHLPPEATLHIGACDNAMTYNTRKLDTLMASPDVDAIIWTFCKNPTVLQNPHMYGWVAVDPLGNVTHISCKIPLSDQPMNDHAVIGAFTFKRAAQFLSCADSMIAKNRRINGEFYVDEVMNIAVESGLRVKVFEVERYICWGTPRDLDVFQYWHGYFHDVGFV